ncbi:hypothetical protein EON79_08225 [bacterium]|nr:MAG: hypothetical protein EON79_08225 [bacterium]
MNPAEAYERWLIYEWSRRNGFSLAWLSVLGGLMTGGAAVSFLLNRDTFLQAPLAFLALLSIALLGVLAMIPRARIRLRYRGRSDSKLFWARNRREEGLPDRRLVRAAQDRERIMVLLKDGYLSREWEGALVEEADLRMERVFDRITGLSPDRLPARHAEAELDSDLEWLAQVCRAAERAVLGGPGALVSEREGIEALRDSVGTRRGRLPADLNRIPSRSTPVYHAVEHLGRWLQVKNTQMQFFMTALGWVGGFAGVQAILALQGEFGLSATVFGLLGGIVVYAIIYFAVLRHRFRPDLDPWRQSYQKRCLAEKLGESAPSLEDAARNREEILLLAKSPAIPQDLRDEMAHESDRRMARAFDLSVGSAAANGLPRAAADRQIAEDFAWLRNAREELESVTLSKLEILEDGEDPLFRLRSIAAEREAALNELRA